MKWALWRLWTRLRYQWLRLRYRHSFAIEDAIVAMQVEHAPAIAYTTERRERLLALLDRRDWSPGFLDALLWRFVLRGR